MPDPDPNPNEDPPGPPPSNDPNPPPQPALPFSQAEIAEAKARGAAWLDKLALRLDRGASFARRLAATLRWA